MDNSSAKSSIDIRVPVPEISECGEDSISTEDREIIDVIFQQKFSYILNLYYNFLR